MSKPRKDRISTVPTGEGLSNPFAGLVATGLPPGREAPNPAEPSRPAPPSKFGRVVLRRETAHRGGKAVLVVDDFATNISLAFIDDLSRRLRKALGCGGTTRGRLIELQGEHAEKTRALLEAEGFRVAGVR